METRIGIQGWGGRVALLLVFGLLAVLAVREVGDPDTGFHLKAGEYLLAGHGWPETDPFTYTLRDHPYIDTSWGYQVLAASIRKAFDSAGLVLFHAGMVLFVFSMLYRTARLRPLDPLAAAGVLALGAVASELRFEARPEILSYGLLVLVLHLLHRRSVGLASPIWLLPLLHLVWANCHSLFIIGWVAMGCFVVGGRIRQGRIDRPLLAWSLGAFAATWINPYGLRGVLFPLTLASRFSSANPFAQSIGEFVSPFALKLTENFPFYPMTPIYCFRLLAFLALPALWVLFRRRHWESLLLIVAVFPLAAGMIRNMPLFVIAAFPGLVWGLPIDDGLGRIGLGERWRSRLRRGGLAALASVVVLFGLRVYHDSYYIADGRPCRLGLGWNRIILPLDAAEFAIKAGLTGPVLNSMNLGGALMWKLPQPIFIDGRLEVVGEDFYREYYRIFGTEEGLESAVARYGIQWIIFTYDIHSELLTRLSRDPRWKLAYVDHLAAIFVREGTDAAGRVDPALESLLAGGPVRPSIRSLPGLGGGPRLSPAGRWLSGLVRREEYPTVDFNLGLFHVYRGEAIRAERRFAAAIQESRGAYYELYADLAASLYLQGRVAEGLDCDRVVLQDAPEDRAAREHLSRAPPTPGR